jgi:nucleoside-diphosphate-sugar epimerase
MANYLVTGGAGFIGSSIARALVTRGDRVRIIDNFSSGRRENFADFARDVELIEADILDPAALRRALEGVEVVFHEAAIPSVPKSMAEPLENHEANATGTLRVLHAARAAGARRLVYAASSAAYGDAPELPKVETMAPAPISPYGASKLAGEYYCQVYAQAFGLETVALRYFNVFGPRQDPKSHYAAVIPKFVNAYIDGVPATIYGDGEQSRDFCFIENTVSANLLACTAKGAAGKMVNIACNERTTLLEVIDILGEIFGKRIAPKHEPAKKGDIKHSLADITAARQALGYAPKVLFAEGLRRTVEWYRQNRG